jgi:hypothetical protein
MSSPLNRKVYDLCAKYQDQDQGPESAHRLVKVRIPSVVLLYVKSLYTVELAI